MLIQCNGKHNEGDIFSLAKETMRSNRWSRYFKRYTNPRGA